MLSNQCAKTDCFSFVYGLHGIYSDVWKLMMFSSSVLCLLRAHLLFYTVTFSAMWTLNLKTLLGECSILVFHRLRDVVMTPVTNFSSTNPCSLSFVVDLYSVFFKVGFSECRLNNSIENARRCLSRDIGFHEEMAIKLRAQQWLKVPQEMVGSFLKVADTLLQKGVVPSRQNWCGLYQRIQCYKLLSSFTSLYVWQSSEGILKNLSLTWLYFLS